MADLKQLAEELVNLTVKDVKELADILKNEYGIEPAAAAVAVAAPAAGGAAAAAVGGKKYLRNPAVVKPAENNVGIISAVNRYCHRNHSTVLY